LHLPERQSQQIRSANGRKEGERPRALEFLAPGTRVQM
jgi:hypothetical protein